MQKHIAAELGIATGTVKIHVRRARLKLHLAAALVRDKNGESSLDSTTTEKAA